MSLPNKVIVFLGRTFSGHNHDYSMLKQEFPSELDWFTGLHVHVDLCYLGVRSDYRGDQLDIPTKKPRKSQKNPNPQLSDAQKVANKICNRSGSENLTLAIPFPYGIPCRHGNASGPITQHLGTHTTRSPSLY
jgi:hypothetical protein